jgi:hypothetical protein
MTTSPSPFSLTAPFTMTIQPGTSGSFPVTNSGTQPLVVHESLERLSVKALKYPAETGATQHTSGTPWLTVDSPASFTLAPGQSETVHISAGRVPVSARGEHFLNLVWAAQPVHAGAQPLHVAGGIATTVGIPMPGVAVPVGPGALPRAPLAPHGGMGAMDLAGAGLGLAAVTAAVALWWRRRRARRTQVRGQVTA